MADYEEINSYKIEGDIDYRVYEKLLIEGNFPNPELVEKNI